MAGETRIGVDIGGTFTDLVTIHDGTVRVTKTPSTPVNPEQGVTNGLELVEDGGEFPLSAVDFLGHGTTVATNAVLERDWADTALITNEGFRDVLEIGRQARPDIYDFQVEKPKPVVPRDRRFEVRGRIGHRGETVTPLYESAIRDHAAAIRDSDVDSVVVCLLFAFENSDHERRVRDILREEGVEAAISLSSDVLPEIREYERTLATALNGALKPVMDAYIGNLVDDLQHSGIDADLEIMQSNGGIITADAARERPINTLLSGPAGGVQGARFVAGATGVGNVVTMDMGGTSCDVSLVADGDPLVSTDVEVGDYPVSVPMIDIHTVGSGGGSIAWLDEGGALRVGPTSAGADPGPICYGRGGDRPTITDAHLVLGRLDPQAFLGDTPSDTLGLDVTRTDVEDVFERTLADPLDMSVEEAAQGVLDVANANMARALRVVSVERGYDPRDFALVAFGGAGPLHATALAAELDIPTVLVPRHAGVLSALGLLISDVIYDASKSHVRPVDDVAPSDLQAVFDEFAADGRNRLADEQFDPDQQVIERMLDLRYAGQSFELSVPVPDGDIDARTLATVTERFHDAHRRRYGHAYEDEPVELVTIRSRARGVVSDPDLEPDPVGGTIEDAIRETREVVFEGDPLPTRIYDRSHVPTNATIDGPAVVEGTESTVVVRPGQHARVDEYGSLHVEVA